MLDAVLDHILLWGNAEGFLEQFAEVDLTDKGAFCSLDAHPW